MATNSLINGWAKAELAFSDRGLQYGDGVFETIAVEKGRLLCWNEHIQRLISGCKRLHIPFTDSQELKEETISLLEPDVKGIIKTIITRGQGGRGYKAAEQPKITRIVSLYPFPDYPPDNYLGITIRICNYKYADNEILAGIKHLNRLEQVLARSEWSDSAIAEGLVLDKSGNVIEGTMSNIFCVKNNILYTPRLKHCGVEGVIRNKIIEQATSWGLTVEIKSISLNELMSADELFICNSVIGIWPVSQVEKRSFFRHEMAQFVRQALQNENYIPS